MLTDDERAILRHATGHPDGYRSHYCADDGADVEVCDRLVERGYMERFERSWVPDRCYLVTHAGREALREEE